MYGGSESVALRSGATVRCAYEDAILVTLDGRHGHAAQTVQLPTPTAGLAGLELVVSPDERLAVLLVYSGQDEQGWELFALEPSLHHLSSLPYVAGEGPAPVFSPDSQHVAMVVTVRGRERGTGKSVERLLKPDAVGEVLIDWATLFVQRVPGGVVEASPVGTWVRRSMEAAEILGWDLYESLRFTGNHRLVLPLPWGGILELRVPLGGPVTTPTPPTKKH